MKRHTDPVEAERVEEEAGRLRTERERSEEPADRRLFEFGAARDTKTCGDRRGRGDQGGDR